MMKVIDKYDIDDKSTVATIEISPGKYVDIKYVKTTETSFACYIMQNADGSTVYGEGGTDETYPGYRYDKNAVMDKAREVFNV